MQAPSRRAQARASKEDAAKPGSRRPLLVASVCGEVSLLLGRMALWRKGWELVCACLRFAAYFSPGGAHQCLNKRGFADVLVKSLQGFAEMRLSPLPGSRIVDKPFLGSFPGTNQTVEASGATHSSSCSRSWSGAPDDLTCLFTSLPKPKANTQWGP